MENEKNAKDEENAAKLSKSNRKGSGKKSKIRWITKTIAEDLDREQLLKVTLREFLIYFVFVIIVTIYITGLRNRHSFYLTKGINSQFVERSFQTVNLAEITFEDIRTAADFWFYLENHFVNSLYWESTYSANPKADEDAMNILGENKVLGVPRLRQVKMSNSSCTVHEYFRRLFLYCFDNYFIGREDQEAFGLGTETAWVYNKRSETKSIPFSGSISYYGGGGFYVDLKNKKEDTLDLIAELKENLWITRGTRAVFLDFTVYNANVNIFGICKLLFEFPSVGGVIPKAIINSLRLIRLHHSYDYFILCCEIIFYCFIIFYICEEVRELVFFKTEYFTKFWSYIDLVIIVSSIVGGVISLLLWIKEDSSIEEIKRNPDKYGNLEEMSYFNTLKNEIFAVDLFFIYVKLFKYLKFNRTMAQLNNTLSRCTWDILGFSIMFFIIFFAFAILGYLLFGSKVQNFSTFGRAMFTLLRTILGDFDYGELEQANRYLAPIYFLSYIFLVFFVLLNMFLAIINDTYADVKTEIAITPDEMQMFEYLRKLFNNLLTKCGCGKFVRGQKSAVKSELNATIKQIREALSKCGFSDLEIEMFFTRYNVSPLAEMHVQDTEKLASELESILRDSTEAEKARYVRIDDFLEQQEKLEVIERTIGMLVESVTNLLSKLEKMENVRKMKQDRNE